jgi:carboxymethylenebutenolidase
MTKQHTLDQNPSAAPRPFSQARVEAGVAWYGRLAGNETARTPRHPVDAAVDLKAPVLGLYGALDTGIPLDTVAAMRAALAEGSVSARASRIEVVPDAPHAFYADYRVGYRHAAAQAAWREMLRWFAARGVAPQSEIQKDCV